MQWHQTVSVFWMLASFVAIGSAQECEAADQPASASSSAIQRTTRTSLRAELFDEAILADNVMAVRNHATRLPDFARFEYLSRWVLPQGSRADFRMNGAFTQTDPAPVTLNPALHDDPAGGTLVSPVFDLLDVAAKTNRLRELRKRVTAISDSRGGLLRRAKLAILVMVNLELGDQEAATQSLNALRAIVSRSQVDLLYDQWPEILVAYRSVNRFPKFEAAGDLVAFLATQRTRPEVPRVSDDWQLHILALARQHRNLQLWQQDAMTKSADALQNWISVVRSRERTRGRGFPQATWHWNENECQHDAGHDDDYLFFRSPLTGNFEFEMDAIASGTTQLIAADRIGGIRGRRSEIDIGAFRTGAIAEAFEPAFSRTGQWVRYRVVFRDEIRTMFINGRLVQTDRLPERHDPWIGIRSWFRSHAMVRDVRITGSPVIPDAVDLSASEDLPGWYSYHGEVVGSQGSAWQFVKDAQHSGEIFGPKQTWFRGTNFESLLQYHRPLAEDGFVAYDFYYEPGRSNTSPAVDRLAFLLDRDDVGIHWITDSEYDKTGLPPDNLFFEPHNRRGPKTLPLKPHDWNHVMIRLEGSTVTLELNGLVVFERELESTNRRKFGLFHYKDQTDVRVRNVVMHGDWPKTLPPVSEQQLANKDAAALDDGLTKLGPDFLHEFAKDGLPETYFEVPPNGDNSQIASTETGVTHSTQSSGKWYQSSISTRLQMHGDFDLSVEFDEEITTGHNQYGGAVVVDFESGHRFEIGRKFQQDANDHAVVAGWFSPKSDGTLRGNYQWLHTEATAGHLRLARRGDTWYAFFAENDSPSYQLVGKQNVEDTAASPAAFRMQSIATDGGSSSVVWKDLKVAAEKLMILPDPSQTSQTGLWVMNADGSQFRQIVLPAEITNPGAPDWSPDGQQIAFHNWTGGGTTSRVFVVNTDGSGLINVGEGATPAFSDDGQRLAISSSTFGTSIANKDGSNRIVIAPEGWGAQWSPNGKLISYTTGRRIDGEIEASITLLEVATNEERQLLEGENSHRYSQIFWNMEWSPDSQQICFKGRRQDEKTEVAIISVDGSSKNFRVLTTESVLADFSWHPDGNSILMAMHSAEHSGLRLFNCDPATGKLKLMKSQPTAQKNASAVWSPDGSQVVFISTQDPKPMLWEPK